MKRWLVLLGQTAVTVALLAWFFHDPEFRQQAFSALRHANGSWLILGICLAGIENFLGVVRWWLFLRVLKIEIPFLKALQICLVALFCNIFMIGAAGGDIVRMAYLIRCGNRKTDSLLSVIMDRVSGLGALVIYTVILTIWKYDWLMQSPIVATMIKFVIAYQLAAVALLVVSLYGTSHGWTNRLPKWAPFRAQLSDFGTGYAKLASHWGSSLAASGLSLVMLLCYFTIFFCSARAFGADITFVELSALMPAADVISALPISLGGVGVREQIFVILLGQLAGISKAMAVSISLVGFFLNMSWGLAGAAILPFFKGIIRDAKEEVSHAV